MRPLGWLRAGVALAGGGIANAQVVMTGDGRVVGTPGAEQGFRVFRGIPYATPPVGSRRWRPPEAPAPYRATLSARAFRPDCWSVRPSPETSAPGQSEDCLYLNIYAPAATASPRPVMVWIHGGAFVGGSPSYARYDGTGFNRRGVILVTFAYRVGVLGFLSHPALTAESPHHASGNYGLLDAIAALRWVRRNIAAFGGDPANVTLFGQSSGSETVHALTLSPLARGLFAKAIGESGAGFGEREPLSLAAGEAHGATYAKPLGTTLAQLRALTPEQLGAAGPAGFEPVVDKWVLPADAHDIYAHGAAADVPTLLGSNADEAPLAPITRADYADRVSREFGARADEILAAFPATDDAQAGHSPKALTTTVRGDYNIAAWADGQARTHRAPVWQYRFGHALPKAPGEAASRGAFHGAEIPYAFATLASQDRPWTATDRALESMLSSYWSNFARSGDPNGPGLPRWDRLDPLDPRVLEITDAAAMAPRPGADRLKLLERVFYGPDGVFRAQH